MTIFQGHDWRSGPGSSDTFTSRSIRSCFTACFARRTWMSALEALGRPTSTPTTPTMPRLPRPCTVDTSRTSVCQAVITWRPILPLRRPLSRLWKWTREKYLCDVHFSSPYRKIGTLVCKLPEIYNGGELVMLFALCVHPSSTLVRTCPVSSCLGGSVRHESRSGWGLVVGPHRSLCRRLPLRLLCKHGVRT